MDEHEDERPPQERWSEIAARMASDPIRFDETLGAYEVLSYELISAILRDPSTFGNEQVTLGPSRPSVATLDPPDHAAVRRIIRQAFSPAAVADLADGMRAAAHELIDQLPAEGARFDVRRAFAIPLALDTIMKLLRIPDSERARLRAGTEATEIMAGAGTMTDEVLSARAGLDEYFVTLGEQSLAQAEAGQVVRNERDPVSALVHAYLDGAIDRTAVIANIATLFVGGNGTTSTLISNAVYALERSPDEKARFLQDPVTHSFGVVEETLRFEASTHGLFRTVMKHTEVASIPMPPGTRLFCRYGAGSRDPAAFPEPSEFDIERDWKALPQHLGFGLGIHHCIGAPLARAEARIALEVLYTRLHALGLAPGARPRPVANLIFRGWDRVDLAYTARTPRRA